MPEIIASKACIPLIVFWSWGIKGRQPSDTSAFWFYFNVLGRRAPWSWWMVFTRNSKWDSRDSSSTDCWFGREVQTTTVRGGGGGGTDYISITAHRGGVDWSRGSQKLLGITGKGRWHWSVRYFWRRNRRRRVIVRCICFRELYANGLVNLSSPILKRVHTIIF